MMKNQNMLAKLQGRTVIPAQLVGYAITLLFGTTIFLFAVQLFADVRKLLSEQTDIFTNKTVAVSKDISIFKTFDKKSIYFDDAELAELRSQDFVKDVAEFKSATFSTRAAFNGGSLGNLMTDMFFESINDKYIDVESEDWDWDIDSGFLPIIIPEDFLNLYNFCFAESQSLPVISKGAIEMVTFTIVVEGNGKRRSFDSRIVGFSSKIKTILVPEKFLDWANGEFGSSQGNRTNRLLVEFTDPSDERIPMFFDDRGYNIDENELETSKLAFVFRMAMLFVFVVAIVIILLSMAFVVMSMNLIIQKNRDMLQNLYNIGYSPVKIARYYQLLVSAITLADVLLAVVVALSLRSACLTRLADVFATHGEPINVWICAIPLLLLLLVIYNVVILRSIKKAVMPRV